jgi:acyl-CoA reductase-like NAD-dependent aldehyde dehydrogenase
MTVLYDPTGTDAAEALSPAASRLSAVQFALEAFGAEVLLGLTETADDPYTGDAADQCRLAVALQVSLQVEKGIDAAAYAQQKVGPVSVTHRDEFLHPVALAIVAALAAGDDVTLQYDTSRYV